MSPGVGEHEVWARAPDNDLLQARRGDVDLSDVRPDVQHLERRGGDVELNGIPDVRDLEVPERAGAYGDVGRGDQPEQRQPELPQARALRGHEGSQGTAFYGGAADLQVRQRREHGPARRRQLWPEEEVQHSVEEKLYARRSLARWQLENRGLVSTPLLPLIR